MTSRQQRQGLRLSVNKTLTSVRQLIGQELTTEECSQLRRKGALLSSYLQKLENYDEQVLTTLIDEAEIEREILATRDFNEPVETAIADCEVLSQPGPSPVSSHDNSRLSAAGDSQNLKVKLPELAISQFEGDPLKWQEFFDAYKSAIHDRSDLATIDKFTYLRGLLVGDALEAIQGFRVTEANYGDVVDLLIQRFGDKQVIVFAHIEALLSLMPASGEAASLVETHAKLERHIRSLYSLQPGQDMILYSIILSKLPRFLKIEAHRKRAAQTDWSLDALRKWLSEEIRAREMGERFHRLNANSGRNRSDQGSRSKPDSSNGFRQKKSRDSTAILVAQSKDGGCPFCEGSHSAENCSKYRDPESRRSQLQNRCYLCLTKGHMAKACRKRPSCKHCDRRNHHSSLCFSKYGGPNHKSKPSAATRESLCATGAAPKNSSATVEDVDSFLLTSQGRKERTIMQTAVVTLSNIVDGSSVTARLFFDTGASRTFITESKCRELHLPTTRKEWLSVSSFQSSKRQTSEHKVVECGIQCRDGSVERITAAVVPSITCPILKVPLNSQNLVVPEWSLSEPLVSAPSYVDVDVLVGMDYYYSFINAHRVAGGDSLWFLSSKVGFIASGRVNADEKGAETVAVMLIKSISSVGPIDPPDIDLTKYWEMEQIGMKEAEKENTADEEAMRTFQSTLKYEENRYQVCWPWKAAPIELKDNYGLAHGRLRSLLNRLRLKQSLLKQYAEVFEGQLAAGIIEEIPDKPDGDVVYYMPHHAVEKSDHATTKLRIVFDASATVGKDAASLNDCLHRGPLLLEDLCGILLRFRTNAVALVSDVEKAFLQIGLQPSQRDANRFLWVRDASQPPSGRNLVAYRFKRVPFGVVSSPFLLAATIAHHLQRDGSEVAQKVLSNIYVDNVVTGEDSPNQAIAHYSEAKRMFKTASLNLRQWYSNSSTVLKSIPRVDKGQEADPKVLGLRWNPRTDNLRLTPVRVVDGGAAITKRRILKTLPQDVWSLQLGWDEEVPNNILQAWKMKILPNLVAVSEITIPRYIGLRSNTICQLHVFCDASVRVCATSVYLRQQNSKSEASVDLLFAKTRLAPLKTKLTIPRLELVAVALGGRVLEVVTRQLRIALSRSHWRNRVKVLRQLTKVEFRYIPTKQNPADLPTRGCSLAELRSSAVWWHGPEWLKESSDCWPSSLTPQESDVGPGEVVPATSVTNAVELKVQALIDVEKYSSLQRLLRVTAYVMRFGQNLRKSAVERITSRLQSQEIESALDYWIRLTQHEAFPQHFAQAIATRKKDPFAVFLDTTGILRCYSRVGLSDLPHDAKHPILLPKRGYFVELVVMRCHLQALHIGVAGTLARLRQQFWIMQGRSLVKRVVRSCRICRRFHGGPFKMPTVPLLPEFRVQEGSPFTNTGVDYLGPLLIRTTNNSSKKVWICLFTCAVTRAVHLEVAEDMTTEQFLLVLRRFIATYGSPRLMVSDNGRNFQMTAKLLRGWLREVQESEDFRDFSSSRGIRWRFIPEKAPWMGGFYERLVAVVKNALRKSLHGVLASLSELQTAVTEISAVVNSRPLVYAEDDVSSTPLTPANIISPLRKDGMPLLVPSTLEENNNPSVTVQHLTGRWRRLQGLVSNFWRAWRSEYLVSLRERLFAHKQRNVSLWPPEIGTVVHLKENIPRGMWRMGKVDSCVPGSDGKVRSLIIRLANGRLIRRPLSLVFPLEMAKVELDSDLESSKLTPDAKRSPRRAALAARDAWNNQLQDESDLE